MTTPRLFIIPDGSVSSSAKGESYSSTIVTLVHPKTGVSTRYLVQDSQIHSIIRISTPHSKRSVFVGDSVISDGMVYVATPQDILFHILPHLQKLTSQHSLPLQDILDDLPTPLSTLTPETLIHVICDCTESSNSYVPDTFKLSTSKVLRILLRKVDALIPVLGASMIAEYVDKPLSLVIGQEPPGNILAIRQLALRKCAMEVISSNLDDQFTQLLFNSTDFTPLTMYIKTLEESRAAAMAATLMVPSGHSEKRPAKEENEGEKKKKVKVSQGVKALEKVNKKGMKDMRSFFKKPVKT